ncbi:MAG: NTE family protein rssA [Rhizobiales bacterium]|nr:NTE family protein rssA [Hyphomicrobiales bacterium]
MGTGTIGLALGGGAARGWAHIGILKALSKAGIFPDVIVGTSIGAVVGGCHAAEKLPQLEEFALSLTKSKVFRLLDFNLAGSGLISGRRLCQRLEDHLEMTRIEELPTRFAAIATELGTGHEIWLTKGRLVDALRASYALPGIFHPVNIKGRWLIDGALVNPIPVSVCRALGAQMVIAVNLHCDTFGRGAVIPDYGFEDVSSEDDLERPTPVAPKSTWSAAQLLHRQFFGQVSGAPGISSVMMDAFSIIQDRIARARLAGDPPDITLKPRLKGIGLFEFHRADELIARGEEAAERMINRLDEIRGPALVETTGR